MSTTTSELTVAEASGNARDGNSKEQKVAHSSLKTSSSESHPFDRSIASLSTWRFWFTMAGLYLGLFLVVLEITIVNTALVSISSELHDFGRATWIVNAYILTWSGCLILWGQFSQTIGRKPSLLVAVALFVAFSAGCAAAQTSTQLIVLRAFQGLAGAGVFQLPVVIVSEVVPPSSLPKYSSFMSFVGVVSFGVGPLIGGAIAANTTWRWVFLLNIPVGLVALVVDSIAIPDDVPHHLKPKNERPKFESNSLMKLDTAGALMFLCGSISIVAVLQEADSAFRWTSALSICLIVLSAASWAGFISWERHITLRRAKIMPLITWKFFKRRPVAMFASSFSIGVIYVAMLVQLPSQLQVVLGRSPLQASIDLLPCVIMISVGTAIGSLMSGKLKVNITAGMVLGASIQLAAAIGFVMTPSKIPQDSTHLPASQYVLQVLIGLGNGLSYAVNFNGMPSVLDGERLLVAPAMAANSQFRYLGGAVGLGSLTTAINAVLKARLSEILTTTQIGNILESTDAMKNLDNDVRRQVISVFTDGYVLQWKIICGFVGLQVVSIMFTY